MQDSSETVGDDLLLT